ncbi:MAG: DUF1837 domain-containing protein [Sandaracinaceae bacterium]|nr:DUF1837 domain-containing protein [Sandaracinaceae bacterium]
MTEALFQTWLVETAPPRSATLRLYHERKGVRAAVLPRLGELLVDHYVGLETVLKAGGLKKAAALVRSSLPDSKQTRSGDLGEIVASEYVDGETNFTVPVRKLNWKSDRQTPMHGNDVIAIDPTQTPVQILKGECKSAASFAKSKVTEAVETLDAHGGRPNPSTIGFIIKRLYELNRDDEARAFEQLLTASAVRPSQITHHLFALCGNDPTELLKAMPVPRRRGVKRLATAVIVPDHGKLIASVFKAAYGTGS